MKKPIQSDPDRPVSLRVDTPIDPEARENLMINYAMNLAEQRMLDGTASSQEVVFYLKLASTRDQLERKKIEKENELMEAKRQSLEAVQRIEQLYANAIAAMRKYQGDDDEY